MREKLARFWYRLERSTHGEQTFYFGWGHVNLEVDLLAFALVCFGVSPRMRQFALGVPCVFVIVQWKPRSERTRQHAALGTQQPQRYT